MKIENALENAFKDIQTQHNRTNKYMKEKEKLTEEDYLLMAFMALLRAYAMRSGNSMDNIVPMNKTIWVRNSR